MGKSKPRNRVRNRSDPIGKPVKAPSDPRILPVLKDLQSADLQKRSTAASLIANLIEDPVTRKQLLRERIVSILFEQTLSDSNLETRTAGWGILRNLALEEEADFCIHLYRQDVITALEGVVKNITPTIEARDTALSNLPKLQQALIWSLMSSIISLLSTLSEAQDEIVQALNKVPVLLNFPFALLALDKIPTELEYEVLLCLMAMTEDNKSYAKHILDHGFLLEGLRQIQESGEPKSVPACGVLHNLFTIMQWYDHNTPVEGHSDAILVPTLVQAIEKLLPNNTNGHSSSPSPDQILQLAVEITASIATGLQEALEHGSRHEKEFEGFGDDAIESKHEINVGANIKDEDEVEEDDEMDEDEGSMNSNEIDADMDLVIGDAPEDNENLAEEVTLDRLVRNAAPIILQLAQTGGSIQPYALSTLTNIAWTISSIDFSTGHLDSLQKLWLSFTRQFWSKLITPVLSSNTADIDLASSVTSLAWALARSAQGVIKIQSGEHRKFMALYQASKSFNAPDQPDDAFQGLGVKTIGVLGRLALDPAPVDLNREIGIFLLTVLSGIPETSAADAVETMNQIFDIYADKSYAFDEPVFWGDGFYKHLEETLPKARMMAKSIDKRKFGELRARADEAVLNLGRFLKYKRNERTRRE